MSAHPQSPRGDDVAQMIAPALLGGVVALVLAPALVAGVLGAEALRARGLKVTWLALLAPVGALPLLVAGPADELAALAAAVLAVRGIDDLAGVLGAGAPVWVAAAPLVGVGWKLRQDRRDRVHGGEREQRLRRAVGPGQLLARRWRRHRQLAGGADAEQGILLGADEHGEPVRVPMPAAHIPIVGGSNTGKTNSIAVWVEGIVAAGFGAVMADGKGGHDLPRLGLELGRRYQRPVALWSITPYGDPQLDALRLPWSVTSDGNPTEIKDRIATAEEQSEPYYKAIAARGVLAACQALEASGQPIQLDALAELLEDPAALKAALKRAPDDRYAKSAEAWIDGLTEGERSGLRGMGLRLQTMVASDGGKLLLPGEPQAHGARREISLYGAIRDGWIVVFTLPQGSYPNLVPHVTRYVISTVNAVCSRLEREGHQGKATFVVDELSAFDGEQLAATLERARSAGVRVILATQSLSNFESAGGIKLLHGALDNAEHLLIHRQRVPEAAEVLAKLAGTEEAWEHTHAAADSLDLRIGSDETGQRNRRLADRFRAHPNTIKGLPRGEAILVTTHPAHQVRRVRIRPGLTTQWHAGQADQQTPRR